MHELSLAQHIISIVSERSKGIRVTQVTLEIGKLSAVLPEAIHFCFDLVTKGTVAEGAELKIIQIPGMGHCRTCGNQFELSQMFAPCTCGSTDIDRLSGEELHVKNMVLA